MMGPHWHSRHIQQDATPLWLQAFLYVTALIVVTFFAAAAMLVLIGSLPLKAQHNHHHHHADYQGWVNKANEGCCNNQDCGELRDVDERTSSGFLEVRIEGQWCPILSKHYLRSGNVPDASTAHVCAWLPHAKPGVGPCERLLCYQPKPMS